MKAESPIVVILDGISSCIKSEHPEKADCPIVVTPDGISRCLKPEHP
jgi:hypothetical protein